jgi:L-fuconolactonase
MIDSHLHVWDRSRSSYRWLNDAPEVLQGDHDLDRAFAALDPHGVFAAVLVQADETLDETAYLLEQTASDDRVLGAVCYLPLEAPDVVARELPRLRERPGFVGVRNLTHDRPDPDWILGEQQDRSVTLLEEAGVPLDYVALLPRHLECLDTLAGRHPGLPLVLDHLGKPPVGEDAEAYGGWLNRIEALAARQNVVAKISGIYGPDGAVPPVELDAVVDSALAVFGADRLMVGSNWPVCRANGGVDATMGTLTATLARLPGDTQVAMRRSTATRVYGLQWSL